MFSAFLISSSEKSIKKFKNGHGAVFPKSTVFKCKKSYQTRQRPQSAGLQMVSFGPNDFVHSDSKVKHVITDLINYVDLHA